MYTRKIGEQKNWLAHYDIFLFLYFYFIHYVWYKEKEKKKKKTLIVM